MAANAWGVWYNPVTSEVHGVYKHGVRRLGSCCCEPVADHEPDVTGESWPSGANSGALDVTGELALVGRGPGSAVFMLYGACSCHADLLLYDILCH